MLTGAEKVGVLGAILLFGGIVAATILYVWPKPPPPSVPPPGEQWTEPGEESPEGDAPEPPPPPPETNRAFKQEIERLRTIIEERENTIALLEARLREAGLAIVQAEPDGTVVAEETLGKLRACGPGTRLADIDQLMDRLVSAGEKAVPPVQRELSRGKIVDVALSPNWNFVGGSFVGYPTLRVALIDALDQIGGVEGQNALIILSRQTDDPLEICLIVAILAEIRVPAAQDAILAAAKRYLTLEPTRSESFVVFPVLEVLGRQEEPEAIAASYLEFIMNEKRRASLAEVAILRLKELPPETAFRALAGIAGNSELGDKATIAARALAETPGVEAVRILEPLLPKMSRGARREVYRKLPEALREEVRSLSRAKPGLETAAAAARLVLDIDARKALLESRDGAEAETSVRGALDASLKTLRDLKREAEKIGKR